MRRGRVRESPFRPRPKKYQKQMRDDEIFWSGEFIIQESMARDQKEAKKNGVKGRTRGEERKGKARRSSLALFVGFSHSRVMQESTQSGRIFYLVRSDPKTINVKRTNKKATDATTHETPQRLAFLLDAKSSPSQEFREGSSDTEKSKQRKVFVIPVCGKDESLETKRRTHRQARR